MAVLSNTMMQGTAAISDDAGGYQIEKGLRFNGADDPHLLALTPNSGNRNCWTYSGWVKRSKLDAENYFFSARVSLSSHFVLGFDDQALYWKNTSDPVATGKTNALFRDTAAWMHVVFVWDSNQPVDTERTRLYVNGKRITSFASVTYPDRGDASFTTCASGGHEIGSYDGGGDHNFEGLIANVHLIDHFALGPESFGSWDSTGVWNPKEFWLPNPNDGTKWSDQTWKYVSDNSTVSWSGALSRAFRGYAFTNNAYPSSYNDLYWEPSVDIPLTTSLSIYGSLNSVHNRHVEVHTDAGVAYTHLFSSGWSTKWHDLNIPYGSTKLTKLVLRQSSFDFGAIAIDGIILEDNKTDPTTKINPNDGSVWSSGITGTTWNNTHYAADKAFDGNSHSTGALASAGNTLTYSGSIGKSGDKIEMYFSYVHDSNVAVTVNSTSITSQITSNQWFTLTGITYPITAMTWEAVSAHHYAVLRAIRVNGHILIDSSVDNSFHLKFNDTTKNRYLGKDTLNGKIADATGGLPIYVTSDDYGDVKGSGYNSEASNSIRDALVLAIPGDSVASGTCDVHQQINTGSSNKTVTVNGSVTVNTDESRLYGSSLYFAGDEDDLQFADHDDFNVGTGDFTIEFWAKPTNTGAWSSIVSWPGSWDSTAQRIAFNDSGKFACGNTTTGNHVGSTVCWDGNWRHYAVVRNGNTFKGYVNGIQEFTFTTSASYDYSGLVIGRYPPSSYPSDYEYKGYVNDFRFYKGLAKYTANFKPAHRNDFPVYNISSFQSSVTNHSNDLTSTTGGFNSDGGPELAFDGNTGTQARINSTGAQLVWEPSTPIHVETSLEFYQASNWEGTNHAYINGVDKGNMATGSTGWLNLNFTGTLEKFEIGKNNSNGNGNAHPCINALRLNGSTTITDSTALTGKDWPGNDSSVDTPTNYGTDTGVGGEIRGNYCTINPLIGTTSNITFTQGNLEWSHTSSGNRSITGCTFLLNKNTGKYYFEHEATGDKCGVGIQYASDIDTMADSGHTIAQSGIGVGINFSEKVYSGSGWGGTTPEGSHTNGSTLGVAIDTDNEKIWFYKDGVILNSGGNPANGTNGFTIDSAGWPYVPTFSDASTQGTASGIFNFGQRAFKYTAPSGFKCLCTQNLDDTFSGDEKNDPSKYFDARTYMGTGGVDSTVHTQTFHSLKFQPEFIWIKNRDDSDGWNMWSDAIRGPSKNISPNSQTTESTNTDKEVTPTSDGFTLEDGEGSKDHMTYGDGYAAWVWDAGTAAATASTDGTITPSAQWVNPTAGFSITQYVGTAANATVGHGLNAAPDFMVHKDITAGSTDWQAWHSYLNGTKSFQLSTSAGSFSQADMWNNTAPTNTVFHLGSGNGTNKSGETIMMYLWTAIPGYSAFGSYKGNNSATAGPFVYTGFRPKWILSKEDGTGGWKIWDTTRTPNNPNQNPLWANITNDESGAGAGYRYDIFSNGFQVLGTSGHANNDDGDNYIYCAFAEHPFKTARAI